MLILKNIYKLIFLIGVFFIPFNSYDGLTFLGEYQKESAALFFFIGFGIFCIDILFRKKLVFPIKETEFSLLYIFMGWCVLTLLLNFPEISQSYFKNTGGINRFFRQFISLLISAFVFLIFYVNVLRDWDLKSLFRVIRKVFLFSLTFVFAYGVVETAIIKFGISSLTSVINIFNYFPFLEGELIGDRISSVSLEPPYLAIFLITITGWMLSYIITEKGYIKYLPAFAILFLTYFSGSRTGLLVIAIQFAVFFAIILKRKNIKKYILISAVVIAPLIAGFFVFSSQKTKDDISDKIESLNFKGNLLSNISNRSRFGMQLASFRVFMENPVIGVGFGQQGFHNQKYFPPWAVTNNYEFRLWYKNPNVASFPPGYNIYTRILAETGIIGFLLFILILGTVIYKSFKLLKVQDPLIRVMGMVLLISFIGISINWLQIDSFRIFGFWIFTAVLYWVQKHVVKQQSISTNSPE